MKDLSNLVVTFSECAKMGEYLLNKSHHQRKRLCELPGRLLQTCRLTLSSLHTLYVFLCKNVLDVNNRYAGERLFWKRVGGRCLWWWGVTLKGYFTGL